MPFISIITDFITLAFYFVQAKIMTLPIFIVGIIVQSIAVLFLLALLFTYKGKRVSHLQFISYGSFTIPYGIIVIFFLLMHSFYFFTLLI